MKFVTIVLNGPGGCGKTTTSQAFALGEPQEFKELRMVQLKNRKDERKIYWTVYDNCALAGNHASGTDANVGPDVIRQAYEECLKTRRIAIVDGYQSSPRWVEMINKWQDEHPEHKMISLVVYYNVGLEELNRRVAKRLEIDVGELSDARIKRSKGNLRRPIVLMKHFETIGETELWVLDVEEEDSPEDIVDMLDASLQGIFEVAHTEDFVGDFHDVE